MPAGLVRSAPMATPTNVQGSVPWLRQACRVPFWMTTSPGRAASRARVAYAAILGLLHLAQTDPDAPKSAVLADEATAVFLPS
jgi:hypothetical protein